jgi:hypothetical protein
MQYTMLIYQNADAFAARSDPARREAFWGAFLPYVRALSEAGVMVSRAGLEDPERATTVRLGSDPHVQDGPYADTKEQLGGFFVLDVADLDAALEWASRCPVGQFVEVRATLPAAGMP